MSNPKIIRLFEIKRSNLIKYVFIGLLISYYLEVPLFITDDFYIPAFITFLILPLAGILSIRKITTVDKQFFFSLALLVVISAVFVQGGSNLAVAHFKGVIQILASTSAAILLLRLSTELDWRVTERIFLYSTLLLVLGTLTEIFGLTSGLSNSFRELAYARGGYGVYDNDLRDLALGGGIRPKFFTSEPSLLAIGFMAFSNCWLAIRPRIKSVLFIVTLTFVMFGLVRSPILILGLLVTITIYLYSHRRYMLINLSLALTTGCIFLIMIRTGLILPKLAERINLGFESAMDLTMTSETLRLVFPYITMIDVVSASPLLGTGISGKPLIDVYSRFPLATEYALGNNNLATIFIYFGIVGGFIFCYLFYRYLSQELDNGIWISLVYLLVLSQSMGGFESPRFWGYVFLMIIAVRLGNRVRDLGKFVINDKQELPMTSLKS